jgi:hypothetical protein
MHIREQGVQLFLTQRRTILGLLNMHIREQGLQLFLTQRRTIVGLLNMHIENKFLLNGLCNSSSLIEELELF